MTIRSLAPWFGGNRRKEAPEVLIVNGPSLTAGGEW